MVQQNCNSFPEANYEQDDMSENSKIKYWAQFELIKAGIQHW